LADTNVVIAEGTTIGYDKEADAKRFPFISSKGIVVLPKGTFVPKIGPIELARDMMIDLEQDPATCEAMAAFRDRIVVADRHSNDHIRST
jgi:hypothetical protein